MILIFVQCMSQFFDWGRGGGNGEDLHFQLSDSQNN